MGGSKRKHRACRVGQYQIFDQIIKIPVWSLDDNTGETSAGTPPLLPHLNLGLRARIHQVLDHAPDDAEGGGRVDDHALPHQLRVVVLLGAGGQRITPAPQQGHNDASGDYAEAST